MNVTDRQTDMPHLSMLCLLKIVHFLAHYVEDVSMCSVTEIPSVMESEMLQNLQCLFSSACPTDNVHDVILQVCAAHCVPLQQFVCCYLVTALA